SKPNVCYWHLTDMPRRSVMSAFGGKADAAMSANDPKRTWPGLSANCPTEMESATADPTITRQVLQVEHVKIETSKKFTYLEAALERSVPQLDPGIGEALATGDEQRATELERVAPLFIFLKRDHGALLQAAKQPRKALQYDIGNPHTASKMTRHRLGRRATAH